MIGDNLWLSPRKNCFCVLVNDMTDDNPKTSTKPPIITETEAGFGVKASPMNGVKLELALWLILAFPVILVLHRIIESEWWRLFGMASYGVVAAAWIIVRARRIAMTIEKNRGQD